MIGQGSIVDKKKTFGFCFSLGTAMVSWCSRKYTSVALSTVEKPSILQYVWKYVK
jgi:hypothetical protein